MYEREPYRPCPVCRTQLKEIARKDTVGDTNGWKYYECQNCGTVIWINPFFGVKTGTVG